MPTRCEATGKVCFGTFAEAKSRMWALKMIWKRRYSGKRIKHRQGKPAQKRVYQCPHCTTYHLTRLDHYPYHKQKEPCHKAKQKLIIPIK